MAIRLAPGVRDADDGTASDSYVVPFTVFEAIGLPPGADGWGGFVCRNPAAGEHGDPGDGLWLSRLDEGEYSG